MKIQLVIIPLMLLYWPFALYTFRIEVQRQHMNKRLVYNSRQIEALDFERRQTMKRLKADSSKKFEALKSADENKAELRPEVEALVE